MRPINSKGYTMSDTTSPAVNAAAKKAGVAAAKVSETLPTVVETVELAMDVPSKVVLNQRLVVITSVVGGATLGAGLLWGVNKLRAVRAQKKLQSEIEADVTATV